MGQASSMALPSRHGILLGSAAREGLLLVHLQHRLSTERSDREIEDNSMAKHTSIVKITLNSMAAYGFARAIEAPIDKETW